MSKKEDYIDVSMINSIIKDLLKANLSETLKVKGEVSNLKMSNGNTFFTLKDTQSSISVVSWGASFDISNGDDIFVTGKLACYTKQGTYNLQAFKVERFGIGNLFETYEKLKKEFEKSGYFSKKRQFPTSVSKIGIVSAYEGAALQDVLFVLKANSFAGTVYIKNCYAQGKYCPKSVKDGIEYFNNLNDKVDIILITRGGGAIEDLMGYSAEIVIKSIWQSNIFTISAVGHEIDTMLSDYAADHRSPTPTRAAEEITIIGKNLLKDYEVAIDIMENLRLQINTILLNYEKKIQSNKILLNALNPHRCIENELNILKNIKYTFYSKIKQHIDLIEHRIESIKLKNNSFDIIRNFEKGFIMITDANGTIVKSSKEFKRLQKAKQKLKLIFTDGEVIL